VSPALVIFSDLDGTLLDAESYSFKAATPALKILREKNIPLVLCSSKTRAEMLLHCERLANKHPFISENGGGIYVPHAYFTPRRVKGETQDGWDEIAVGIPHAEVRRVFMRLRSQLGVAARGFTDMTVAEITQLTGLDKTQAALARKRDFDEPFVFDGKPDTGFLRAIEQAGLTWTEGRIFHIMGRHDKGAAVRHLRALYERHLGPITTLGLGDGLNDLSLLKSVDFPVLVTRRDVPPDPRIQVPGLIKTCSVGPKGWNDAVLDFLSGARVAAPPGHVEPVAS
jgi:mannosyl-3-phosphoglycerate phosphatase family protein